MSDDNKKKRNPFDLPPLPPPPPPSSGLFPPLPSVTSRFGALKQLGSPKDALNNLENELKRVTDDTYRANIEAQLADIKAEIDERQHQYEEQLKFHEEMLRQAHEVFDSVSDALPFRKALVDDATLLDTINHNLAWFRLVIWLYGGISDNGLATYLVRYLEIAAVLQLEDAQRGYYVEWLKQKPYWNVEWEKNNDTVYNMAVYLDNEGGKLNTRASKHVPQFTPYTIFSDSPLTPIILNALKHKKEPTILIKPLWQEWQAGKDDLTRAHALMALLLVDTNKALKTIIHLLGDDTQVELAQTFINQLALKRHQLKDILILLGRKGNVGSILDPEKAQLSDDQWADIIRLFYRTLTTAYGLPVSFGEPLMKGLANPYINAEIWAYWLSGWNGDDARYNFAVILDTIGKKIASTPAMLNLHLAYNTQADLWTQWEPLVIPPIYDEISHNVGEMLTVAQHSSSTALKELMPIGIIQYAGVNYKDHMGLAEDALIVTLFFDEETQGGNFNFFAPIVGEKSFAYDGFQTIAFVMRRLKDFDIITQARIIWRVAQYNPYWSGNNLWDVAIAYADNIPDPLHRARALERLISYLPPRQSEQVREDCLVATRQISDPNNRARALARLALYENDDKRWALFDEALQALRTITDDRQKADLIMLLRPYIAENPSLTQTLAHIVTEINDVWLYQKADDLLAIQLLAYHDQLTNPRDYTPMVLVALIDDILAYYNREELGEDWWGQLLDVAQREKGMIQLLKLASDSDIRGLTLTSKAYMVIQKLIAQKEIASIHMLIPYLKNNDIELLPILRHWVKEKPDTILWAYAGLMLAEMGQMDDETMPCVLYVVEHGVDFGRYRANITLHGDTIFVQKKKRDYRSSQLGEKGFLLLGETYQRLNSQKPYLASPIIWSAHNIIHDDVALFLRLIEHHESDELGTDTAASFLRQISYCTEPFVEAFVNTFEKSTDATKQVLIQSWLYFSSFHMNNMVSREHITRMENAIRVLPDAILDKYIYIPDRLVTIGRVIRAAKKEIETGKMSLPDAVKELDTRLREEAFTFRNTDANGISSHAFYKLDTDPSLALDVARDLSEDGIAVELLFEWLAHSLKRDVNDTPLVYYRTSTLLELAGCITQFSPAAVYNLNQKHQLGDDIVKAVIHHRTFWGKAGAATLLGYLSQTPKRFDEAILSALHDVAEVQVAVIASVRNLRYLDEKIIPKMLKLLHHSSASVVYTNAKLLTSIARNEKTSYETRQTIVKALSNIITETRATCPVYILDKSSSSMFIRNIGKLNQELYACVMNIMGIL